MEKNNKGYSLVELVISVAILMVIMAELGTLMVRSMHMYRNGFYEVSLQEEAQQVILQLEDILMSATIDGGVHVTTRTFTSGVQSDVITIDTSVYTFDNTSGAVNGAEQIQYVIGLATDVYDPAVGAADATDFGTDLHKHERLMMKKTTSGGTSYAILAEGVESIRLRTLDDSVSVGSISNSSITGFETADMLVLTIEMRNEQYTYSSTKDVYLRNQIGTGGPTVSFNTASSSLDLNVLRIHTYNLNNVVPEGYKYFRFQDPSFELVYTLNNSDQDTSAPPHVFGCAGSSPTTIKAQLSNTSAPYGLGNWDNHVDECIIECAVSDNMANAIELKVYTEAFRMDDMPLYAHTAATGRGVYSVMPVYGVCICPSCMKACTITCEVAMQFPSSYTNPWWPEGGSQPIVGFKYSNDPIHKEVEYVVSGGGSVSINNAVLEIQKYNSVATPQISGDALCFVGTSDVYNVLVDNGNPTPQEINYGGTDFGNGKIYDQVCPVFNFGLNQLGNTINNLTFECTTHVTGSETYYKALVNQHHGYLRLHIVCEFNTGTPTYKAANMYLMPMDPSYATEQEMLWDIIHANRDHNNLEMDPDYFWDDSRYNP